MNSEEWYDMLEDADMGKDSKYAEYISNCKGYSLCINVKHDSRCPMYKKEQENVNNRLRLPTNQKAQ